MSGLPVQFVRRRVNVAARTLIDGRHRSTMPEYRIWAGMLARCLNPSTRAFPYYGARGITVCDSWREDFASFYADMGPRPSPRHSIDRIDNNGPYAPFNCRWATPDMQCRNKRKTIPENRWSDSEIATLKRMWAEYWPAEDIARELKRSLVTVRLRASSLGLRRDMSLTRLARKHAEIAHILRESGHEAFVAAIAAKIAGEKSAAAATKADTAEAVQRAIASIQARTDISRDEKMKLMRLGGASLADVAREFGITRERVRQIQAKNYGTGDATARKVYRTNPKNRQRHVDRLMRAWRKASEDARLEFLSLVGPASSPEVAA